MDWIYRLQSRRIHHHRLPAPRLMSDSQRRFSRVVIYDHFREPLIENNKLTNDTKNVNTSPAHLPSTYTALLSLALLRASLDRLNIPGLIAFLRSCQARDGSWVQSSSPFTHTLNWLSFSPVPLDPDYGGHFQNDLRMTYCASVVSSIIDEPSGIDVESARTMIENCRVRSPAYRPLGPDDHPDMGRGILFSTWSPRSSRCGSPLMSLAELC